MFKLNQCPNSMRFFLLLSSHEGIVWTERRVNGNQRVIRTISKSLQCKVMKVFVGRYQIFKCIPKRCVRMWWHYVCNDKAKKCACSVALKLYNSYLESLVPLFDGGLVVWRMRLQEVHIFFGEFIFTHEATHLGKLEQKEKTLIRLDINYNFIIEMRN